MNHQKIMDGYTRDDHTHGGAAPSPDPEIVLGAQRVESWVRTGEHQMPVRVIVIFDKPKIQGHTFSFTCPACGHQQSELLSKRHQNPMCDECVENTLRMDDNLRQAIAEWSGKILASDISVSYEFSAPGRVNIYPKILSGQTADFPGRTIGDGSVLFFTHRTAYGFRDYESSRLRELFPPPGEGSTEDDARRYLNWHGFLDKICLPVGCPYEKRGSK